jgi:Zn finger protein HypA/HybF involved in hydrogenase expression
MKLYSVKLNFEVSSMAVEETSIKPPKSITKFKCFNCEFPLKRDGIKNFIICPNCRTKNPIE